MLLFSLLTFATPICPLFVALFWFFFYSEENFLFLGSNVKIIVFFFWALFSISVLDCLNPVKLQLFALDYVEHHTDWCRELHVAYPHCSSAKTSAACLGSSSSRNCQEWRDSWEHFTEQKKCYRPWKPVKHSYGFFFPLFLSVLWVFIWNATPTQP